MIVDCLSIAEDKIKSEFHQQAILRVYNFAIPQFLINR